MICFDKSISDRKGRSRLFPRLFLLGFLLYGLNAAAQEPDSVLSAKASKSTRQKTSVLASEKQDTVVFRFAPKRRMFWADYKGNAAAINSLTQSIRQHKLSIESGDMKVRMLGFCSSYDSFKTNLAAAKNRSNQVKSYFIVHEGLKEEHFRTTNSTQRWRGMTDVIAVPMCSVVREVIRCLNRRAMLCRLIHYPGAKPNRHRKSQLLSLHVTLSPKYLRKYPQSRNQNRHSRSLRHWRE